MTRPRKSTEYALCTHPQALGKSNDSIGPEHALVWLADVAVTSDLICQPHAKRGCGPEVSTMCPSAIIGPLSLTTLGSPVCWKVTAVTAAAQPTAALFSFAKPISILLGAPRTDSTTLLASFLSGARTRTNARSFTSNEYSFMTPLERRFVGATS